MRFRFTARGAAAALVCAVTLVGGTNAAQAVEPDGADIDFILAQIKKAEAHAAGGDLLGPGPDQVGDATLPYGLRTVNGRFNNLVPAKGETRKLVHRIEAGAVEAHPGGKSLYL